MMTGVRISSFGLPSQLLKISPSTSEIELVFNDFGDSEEL